MASEQFSIAQVSPFPWEDEHDVNLYVQRLANELDAHGHRVVVLAPSRSPEAVRESRRRVRAASSSPDQLFKGEDGGVSVIAVGELLPFVKSRRSVAPAPPIDIARTIEEALDLLPLDFVHVHEPFAPSSASVALRYSTALNVGSFHAPTERVLSTQVARKFVERFFGRLDARTVAFPATADLMGRFFPGDYQLVLPGADLLDPAARQNTPDSAPLKIGFSLQEERASLRLFLRALRRLPLNLEWEAKVYLTTSSVPALPSSIADRVTIVDGTETDLLKEIDVLVAASNGQTLAPGLIARALGAGAIPVVSDLGPYQDLLVDGELGLAFPVGDPNTLAAQLERLIRDDGLRANLETQAQKVRPRLQWSRVADEYESIYRTLAARRHSIEGNKAIAKRIANRPLIDVDLHMHTDHSYDCATPVEVLLATAKQQGLGAIAVTDHNEVSGALEAQAKAEEFGVKVIVAEEVKTASQGEIIGLFIKEKIPRGLTLRETIDEIKAQGGLVYVPHPFDRLHSVPDYENLLDIIEEIDALEIFNPRVAISAYNDEAVRFAAKYRMIAGAGSDSHVAQGLGSVRIRMRDFDGPEEFLESLREADIIRKPSSLLYVQALKFLQTKATPRGARKASKARRVRKAIATQSGPSKPGSISG